MSLLRIWACVHPDLMQSERKDAEHRTVRLSPLNFNIGLKRGDGVYRALDVEERTQ
jgi:hypothetical protein